MADPETVQSRPPLETTTLRQGRGVPLGALVCDQVEYVSAAVSVDKDRDLYIVDTTAGSVTVTLPELATVALGKAFTFYKPVAANSMIVDGYLSETIEGAANETRTAQYAVVTVRKVQTGASSFAWMLAKADVVPGTLADDSVDSAQIADGAVDLVHMSANSVDSDQYVDGSIDLVHMSANSVDSDQYVDGSIDPIHIAAVSVAPAADAAAAILNTTTEVLVSTASGANTAIATTSSVPGQRVFLRMTAAAGGGSYTLVVSGGTLTLNSVGESAEIIRNVANSAWHVLALTIGDAGGAAATVV